LNRLETHSAIDEHRAVPAAIVPVPTPSVAMMVPIIAATECFRR
jgi:hypothetical protein